MDNIQEQVAALATPKAATMLQPRLVVHNRHLGENHFDKETVEAVKNRKKGGKV